MSKSSCIYTIPADTSFVDSMAQGLLAQSGDDPLSLARMRVLLPTRRACRTLREAFLRMTQGRPLLLPRMDPIGDIDEEELSLTGAAQDEFSLPPAIPALQRQFMLTRLIGSLQTHSRGLEQDMALAQALARLMDQIYTEDLDLANLPRIVDREDFAEHWQISIDFLSILSEAWPKILTENGMIDAADRRNRLLKKLAADWSINPPDYPVIAAGSTGSIPATAQLLNVIAHMSHGCIVLPGLDQDMDDDSWAALDDTHPQATLRQLLKVLDTDRHEIKPWAAVNNQSPSPILSFVREVMRPAETAQEWQQLKSRSIIQSQDIHFERYDCANQQEEALVIALALRETLQNPARTAALVTPDRRLARRVAMACRRWNIEIDDSAGEPLSQTTVGTYLRLCMEVVTQDLKPVALLNFTKHALCQPSLFEGDWRSLIRSLDRHYLRGPLLGSALELARIKMLTRGEPRADIESLLTFLEEAFSPLMQLAKDNKPYPCSEWCKAHLKAAELFCAPSILWSGQDGESAAALMAELREQATMLPPVTASQYLTILETCMKPVAVRPAYGLHPRLMILGQLEARLVKTDVMILSGLNEGTWPPSTGVDPWMSRPMRKRFGLPSLERSIGLAAHDFVQALCAPRVILTRSVRVDGTPTVPSRWLQRMNAVLQACGIDPLTVRGTRLLSFAKQMDHTPDYLPWGRPKPTPPVSVRPTSLSATQIETWMQDPYSIYAGHILRLKKLNPIEQDMDAALKGTLIHKVLQRIGTEFENDIPLHAERRFLEIVDEELAALTSDESMVALWRPRLAKVASWYIGQEKNWRREMKPEKQEAEGHITITVPEGSFTLKARADRIDSSLDSTHGAIIDYKSGGTYSLSGMKSGLYPQLPLEALILEGGGFSGIKNLPVSTLSYWIVSGSKDGGEIKQLQKPLDLETAKINAHAGLTKLVRTFYDERTPYFSLPNPERAPRFNHYEHLARVLEWTALDEREDAA